MHCWFYYAEVETSDELGSYRCYFAEVETSDVVGSSFQDSQMLGFIILHKFISKSKIVVFLPLTFKQSCYETNTICSYGFGSAMRLQ